MESPLKPEYDDAMLEGAFEGAYLTKRYENITRVDGFANRDFVVRRKAKKLATRKASDGIVAGGIATAILDSIIIYGDVGEKFLKEKLEQEGENFSQEEYAIDIAKSITELYQYDRKQKIIDGVKTAFCDDQNNIEVNIAKTAIMQNEYLCEDRFSEADVLGERFLNEGNIINIRKIYRRLECMHYKDVSDEQALRNLNLAYNYLKGSYDKISNPFKEEFTDLSENKILAYYIANLHEDEMQEVLKVAKEEMNREER